MQVWNSSASALLYTCKHKLCTVLEETETDKLMQWESKGNEQTAAQKETSRKQNDVVRNPIQSLKGLNLDKNVYMLGFAWYSG